MEKIIVLVLATVCVLGLVGCNTGGNEAMGDFIGVVTNIGNDSTSYLMKVIDSGSSNLKVGDRVMVQLPNGEDAECSVDDFVKIEFNGAVEELVAVSMADKRISVVFSVKRIEYSAE